jgi:hypothetical protein
MVYFTKEEKELSHGIYRDMAEAVAAAVARRESTQPTVFVAAYMHRFGIDFTAHATRELAERRLQHVAAMQCARDEALRERVVDRFGAWPAQDISADSLQDMIDDWHAVADGEALWVAECDVEVLARHTSEPCMKERTARDAIRPCVKPYPPPINGDSEEDTAGEFMVYGDHRERDDEVRQGGYESS